VNRKAIRFGSLILSFIVISYIFLKFIVVLKPIVYSLIISLILTYLLNPAVNYFHKKGISRALSILIVFLICSIVIILLVIYFLPIIIEEIKNLIIFIPETSNKIRIFTDHFQKYYMSGLPPEIKQVIYNNISKVQILIIGLLETSMALIIALFSQFFFIIVIPVFTFYFLRDVEKISQGMFLFIPNKFRDEYFIIIKEIDEILNGYIRGQLLVSFLVGFLTTISLLILKIKFSLLIGIVTGLFNIIPYFGPIFGLIPAAIMGFIESPFKGFLVTVVFLIIQQVESGILSPKIIGDRVGLHPIVVIISLLIGGQFFGVLGLLLTVPVVAILRVLIKHVIEHIVSGIS